MSPTSRRTNAAAALRDRLARARAASRAEEDDQRVIGAPIPTPIKLAAGWIARLLIIGVGVYFGIWLLETLAVVVIPAVVSLLLAGLLMPLVKLFRRIGLPKGLAPVLAFLTGVIVLGGLVTLIVRELVANYDTIFDTVREGLTRFTKWLEKGPLKVDSTAIDKAFSSVLSSAQSSPGGAVDGAVTVVSTAGSVLSGILLTLFTTYFFMADGRPIWRWTVHLFPRSARWKINRAGESAWIVLEAYMGVSFVVAAIVGIATGIACLIAGVPLALSAGLVAFLFAFIPTIGGIISSIVVVLLTLVSTSFTTSVVMGIVMVGIQTVQGNLIYPIMMNRRLKVHPLASLLLVVMGSILGGVFGALIAVPLAAVVNTAWAELFRAAEGLPAKVGPTELGPDDDDELDLSDFEDPTIQKTALQPDTGGASPAEPTSPQPDPGVESRTS